MPLLEFICYLHTVSKTPWETPFFAIDLNVRDWSLITGRGGLQNGKIAGPKLFATPLKAGIKLFAPPRFKEWKLFTPPLQYG